MIRSAQWLSFLLCILCALQLSACDEHDDGGHSHGGEGDFNVKIYGEPFIEQGIPAETFVDGWSITFDRFLVSVSAVGLEDDKGTATAVPGAFVFDVALDSTDGHDLATARVEATHYPFLTYSITPLTAAETTGNASADDVKLMRDNGYSVYIQGTAKKGDTITKTFSWGFTKSTVYKKCAVVNMHLETDKSTTSTLTIHGDHMFYDDLESEEPNVAFDLIATADANTDNTITIDELKAIDITGQTRYQVGSRPITNLHDFIQAQSGTLGHIDGEGHCDTE